MTPERALEHDVVAALQDVVRDLVAAIAPHTQGCEVCKKMLSRHAAIIRVTKSMPTDPVASLNVLSALDDGGALETIKAEAREWEIKEHHWHAHYDAMVMIAQQAQDEVDRLTRAASESARTLQVEIEQLRAQVEQRHYVCEAHVPLGEPGNHDDQCPCCEAVHLADQVTALREAVAEYFNASSRLYAESGHLTTPKARAKEKLLALLTHPPDAA